MDESLFRDSERIVPNWLRDVQGDDRASLRRHLEATLGHFLELISAEIRQGIQYPPDARRRGQQGTVLVGVLFPEADTLPEIEIARSSGYELLDQEALRAVRAIDPAIFPTQVRSAPEE